MKKRVGIVFVMVFILAFTGLMTGCDNNASSKNNTSSAIELSYGKKYMVKSSIREDYNGQYYYEFKSDGTGIFRELNNNRELSNNIDYTVTFRYLIIEETVICFYDSVQYGAKHNNNITTIATTWTATLGFSKDILMTTGDTIYICEDYLKNIPNFGK